MEPSLEGLAKEEIKQRISELEQSYAELLGDDCDYATLNKIWKEIKLLQAELKNRK